MTTQAGSRVLTLGAVAWLLILVAIGGVQYFRGAYIDGTIFAVAVVALVADAARLLPRPTRLWRMPRRPVLVAAGVLAGILILAPRHGLVAGIAVAALGVAVIVFAWPDRPAGRQAGWTRPTVRAAVAWSVVGVVTSLWELSMYLLGNFAPDGRNRYPALSDLVDPLVDNVIAKSVFVIGWLLIGILLLRRTAAR